jgi:PAS domain-containing protein
MSASRSIADDPEAIRARAIETLFERLEKLCEGTIAIDRTGRVVYVNEKYLPSLGLSDVSQAIGRPIEAESRYFAGPSAAQRPGPLTK